MKFVEKSTIRIDRVCSHHASSSSRSPLHSLWIERVIRHSFRFGRRSTKRWRILRVRDAQATDWLNEPWTIGSIYFWTTFSLRLFIKHLEINEFADVEHRFFSIRIVLYSAVFQLHFFFFCINNCSPSHQLCTMQTLNWTSVATPLTPINSVPVFDSIRRNDRTRQREKKTQKVNFVRDVAKQNASLLFTIVSATKRRNVLFVAFASKWINDRIRKRRRQWDRERWMRAWEIARGIRIWLA